MSNKSLDSTLLTSLEPATSTSINPTGLTSEVGEVVGEGVALGVLGMLDGFVVGFGLGVAFLTGIATPLFQISFFPDFIAVYFLLRQIIV